MPSEHVDVLIVGAGLSGIGAGYHLQQKCRGKSYAIIERRDCIGGIWDLFRHPGIRKGMMYSDVPNLASVVRLHQRVVDA